MSAPLMLFTSPDELDDIDASAKVSTTIPGRVRAAWLAEIQAVADEHPMKRFDAATVRARLPEELRHGSEVGALFRHLSKSGAAVMVGTKASGYTQHRADTTIIKVWRLERRVWPEEGK